MVVFCLLKASSVLFSWLSPLNYHKGFCHVLPRNNSSWGGNTKFSPWLGTVTKIILFAVLGSMIVGLVVNKLYPWYHWFHFSCKHFKNTKDQQEGGGGRGLRHPFSFVYLKSFCNRLLNGIMQSFFKKKSSSSLNFCSQILSECCKAEFPQMWIFHCGVMTQNSLLNFHITTYLWVLFPWPHTTVVLACSRKAWKLMFS